MKAMIDIDTTNESKRTQQILNQIDLKEQRLSDKMAAISQLQYEKELIEKDIVDTIKTDLNTSYINLFRFLNPNLLSDIWREWLNKSNDKQFKYNLNYVLNIIKSKLLNNDDNFVLKNILDFCFSAAYEFIFDYKGQEILVYIPAFTNVTEKNKPYIMCGYMIQYKENEHTWTSITNGFDTDKISKDLKEWLEKCQK